MPSLRRPFLSILVLAAAGAAAVPAVARQSSVPPPAAQTAPLPASVLDAWGQVRAALTPAQQANAVRGFLSALAAWQRRPTPPPMDARDIASGRAVSLDDPALLQRPQTHEVTVTVGGQFLVFRPLSRASLEPFFGR
ncbi:hypothetical protein SH203_00872 [Brevundimonas sp. SH203]|uniref:hypothetical protein n=1 Tax=Brevundimonas sp. SH203 TaxID=345167 RepID=UPI0009C44D60|nr:hypothetical protein [Brevundimonas sp. SH203]GAW40474.1 hypothetical protein SH203_00872 [Brevundimonas sp. SH203]